MQISAVATKYGDGEGSIFLQVTLRLLVFDGAANSSEPSIVGLRHREIALLLS
jgi:hypothetical protein